MPENTLRLYPFHADKIAGAPHEDLAFGPPESRYPSRPYVIINMVSSVDGKVVMEGKASRIGSETDRRAMRTLRSKADAVMIGASTLRAEKLSLGLDDHGPQPLAVIATRTGDLPLENLIVGEHQDVLVLTTNDAPKSLDGRLRERARVLRVTATPPGGINLEEALEVLKIEYAIEVLLVEGGPRLNYALICEDLADELFLTLAPKLLGGTVDEILTVLDGPALQRRKIKLLSAHLAEDELFLRYSL